jgi:hypothetical protein
MYFLQVIITLTMYISRASPIFKKSVCRLLVFAGVPGDIAAVFIADYHHLPYKCARILP